MKVADPVVVSTVGQLLGVADGRGAAVGGWRAASGASAPPTPADPGRRDRSELPDRLHPRGVKAAGSGLAGADDRVIEQGLDDRDLPVQVERVPRSA